MAAPLAIGSEHVTALGVGIVVALIVIGAVLTAVVSAIVGRILVLVVVVVLAIAVYQQREHVRDKINAQQCDLHASFFGFSLDPPDSVVRACRTRTGA